MPNNQRNSSVWSLPCKKISDRQWSARSWQGLGLVLPLAFALGLQNAAAQTQTINLNTGWTGQGAAGPAIGLFQPDDDWRVTADPIVKPVPRPAVVVSNITSTHIKWVAPLPNSGWIAGATDKYMSTLPNPPTHFTYEACFTLPPAYSAPTLKMQIRADDIVRQVRLNSTVLYKEPNTNPNAIVTASPTKAGSFLGPPLSINQSTGFGPQKNCVDIDVDDEQQIISGLNATVAVTYCNIPPQDLSTGVAPWTVNGAAAHKTVPVSSWANKDPNGVQLAVFPTGTQWIQPANATNPLSEPGGLYKYVLKFNLPCPGTTTVSGWFAADDTAIMQIDSNPPVKCSNWPNYCFQQSTLTKFSPQTISGTGPHTITFQVTNMGPASQITPTGLLAHITVP